MRPISIRAFPDDVQERVMSKRSVSATAAWSRRKKKAKRAQHHDDHASLFRTLCRQSGLPMPITEHVFHPTRKWRWDFAWPEEKIAIEVDGGLFTAGAHVRGARILLTHEKVNASVVLGWRILYRVPKNLCTSETIELVRQALAPPPRESSSFQDSIPRSALTQETK